MQRFLVEEKHPDSFDQYRLRAWLHPEYDTLVQFEVAHCFNATDWQVEVRGEFKWDDCANIDAGSGIDGTLVHTCGFDGFADWLKVLARIPEAVKKVRAAAEAAGLHP